MSTRTAIVTLTVGEETVERWRKLCEANWREYAARHGYEVVYLDQPLDDSQRARDRSPSWQKLLVPEQDAVAGFDRLIWVDADVVFSRHAPAITDGVPLEKVGAVDEVQVPDPALLPIVHPKPREEYYGEFGLPGSFPQIVQAGVMVFSPDHHRDIFRHVYDAYEDIPGMFYEMRPLSYELLSAGLVSWIDPRFNMNWAVYRAWRAPEIANHNRHPRTRDLARRALEEDVHCLHFAGEQNWMEFVLGEPARVTTEPPKGVRTPVALLGHGEESRARVLEAIAAAEPEQVLVIDEGGVAGIDRAFSLTDEAILLEDGCTPDPTFLRFCDELLERHRGDPDVMSIAGGNFQFDGPLPAHSYRFSRYPLAGGWASWRRAWELNDPAMADWPALRDEGWLESHLDSPNAVRYWTYVFEKAYLEGGRWDRAWTFTCWRHGGLSAIPSVNLVTSSAQGHAGHDMPQLDRLLADLPAVPMSFPLSHPPDRTVDESADRYVENLIFSGNIDDMFGRVRMLRRFQKTAT